MTLISMIRDEKNIIEFFCAHALSLFDRVIFIDHFSVDGTREYLRYLSERYPQVECYFFNHPGRYQSEVMTWAVQNLVNNEEDGWVFFLDADEFLLFKSREEFASKLSELKYVPVISMPWLNMIPLEMDSGSIFNARFLQPLHYSRYKKIAFQPNRISDSYIVSPGNHRLYRQMRGGKQFQSIKPFPMYHFPIRTKQQLCQKITLGVESFRHKGSNRTSSEGFHFEEIYKIIESNDVTNEMMMGIIARYSEHLSPPYEKSLNELGKEGYKEVRIDIGFSTPMIPFDDVVHNTEGAAVEQTDEISSTLKKVDSARTIIFDAVTCTCALSNAS